MSGVTRSFYSRFCELSSKFNFVVPGQSVHNCCLLTRFVSFISLNWLVTSQIFRTQRVQFMTYYNKDLCLSTSISVTACACLQKSEHRNLMSLYDFLALLTVNLTNLIKPWFLVQTTAQDGGDLN